MFRKIITLIILLAFAVHTFSKVMIVFGFYANQKVIAATLCENKDKPILKCEGTCQLAKKLKAQEKKENQNPDSKGENKPEDLSSRSYYSSLSFLGITDTDHTYENGPTGKPVHRSFAVFHPPGSQFISLNVVTRAGLANFFALKGTL